MERINILVVDDLRSMRLTLGAILEDAGHHVVVVENGYEAITATRKTHFDAIFMDIKMPGINGVQTFREIKRIDPKATVIMMTGYSVENLLTEALEEGAYAVVHKPFDIGSIVALIEKLLHERTLILVVDAQFHASNALKTALEQKGYRVATTEKGFEALEMVKSHHYDIVFLDARLPDMNSIQVFERVKEIDPQATVIMMTTYSSEHFLRSAIKESSCACIQKPFDMEKVIGLVEEICEQKKA